MRSLLVTLFILGTTPFIVVYPVVGLYVYSWISYMNPHRLTWGFAYSFPFAFIVGSLTLAAWLFSKEPKKLPLNACTLLMIFFTIWISITTVFAVAPDPAFAKWSQVMKIMFITFLTIVMVTNRRRLEWLLWVIVISIGYFAVKGGIFAVLTGGAYRVWGPPDSMIEENNALALASIMTVPLVRALQLNARNRWLRRALMISIPIMVVSALASYSRGALVAMTVMAIFLWLKSRRRALLGVGIAIMAGASIAFMPDKWFDRMDTLKTYEQDLSARQRLNAWAFAFNFALDHPIVGGGFDVFYVASLWPQYAPEYGEVHKEGETHNAHSVYFEILAMHGFPGLFMFLTICLLAFRYGTHVIRLAKDRPELNWARDIAAMTQVSIIGFGAGGAFLNLAFFDLFWHLIAILVIVRNIVMRNPLAEECRSASRQTVFGRDGPQAGTVAPSPIPVQRSFLRKADEAKTVNHGDARPYRR